MSILVDEIPRAREVEFAEDSFTIHLADGRSVIIPLEWFPKLRDANLSDLQSWRLIGNGVGIHWNKLDEDLSVKGLLMPAQTFLKNKSA